VKGLAGVVGRPQRICDECLELCFDILVDEDDLQRLAERGRSQPAARERSLEELEEILRASRGNGELDESKFNELIAGLRRRLDGPLPRTHHLDFVCSFCDRSQKEVRKLIAGPTVYICDACIADGGALFPRVLRA
jgi:hypothetical protein